MTAGKARGRATKNEWNRVTTVCCMLEKPHESPPVGWEAMLVGRVDDYEPPRDTDILGMFVADICLDAT